MTNEKHRNGDFHLECNRSCILTLKRREFASFETRNLPFVLLLCAARYPRQERTNCV